MMRPKTTDADLPTTHDILNHLHNEFVKWLQQLKTDIEVIRVLLILLSTEVGLLSY